MWKAVHVWLRFPQREFRLPFHLHPRSHSTAMGAAGQHTVHTTERLLRLREQMKKEGNVQAFVVPSEDQRAYTCFYEVAL